jgi:predicted SprT family Zn-dependent metalloprotease
MSRPHEILQLEQVYISNCFGNINITFNTSNKFKNLAGYCKYYNDDIEITFSKYILEKIYNDKFEKININGVTCNDIVDVLIGLMEHEITHLILFIYDNYKNDVKSGHNSQFKSLVYNMYRHTKVTHDLLFGDINKYEKHKKEAIQKLEIGMKIKCKKNTGIIIDIRPKYIFYKNETNKINACKFNEYEIIDKNFMPYQKYISNLKKKLKIGVEVKWSRYYGPIVKVTDNRVYFRDENTSRIIWCLIDIVEFY